MNAYTNTNRLANNKAREILSADLYIDFEGNAENPVFSISKNEAFGDCECVIQFEMLMYNVSHCDSDRRVWLVPEAEIVSAIKVIDLADNTLLGEVTDEALKADIWEVATGYAMKNERFFGEPINNIYG